MPLQRRILTVTQEYTKPIIQDGTPEARRSAIDTLYTALEGGLTMLHPYMPFLTEELWQRLARRPGDKTETIMRAAYPQYRPDWDDATSEASYEMILDAAAAARSLAAQHGVKNAKAAVKLHKGDDKEAAKSIISVQWLSGKAISEVKLLAEGDAEPAEGWASNTSEKGSKVFVEVPARPLSEEKKVQELEKKMEQTKV